MDNQKKIERYFKQLGFKEKDRLFLLEHNSETSLLHELEYYMEIKSGKVTRRFILQEPPDVVKKRGVYRIIFGDEEHSGDGGFYVGRSKYIAARRKQHAAAIEHFFKTGTCIETHYFKKVFDYLKDHPLDSTFTMELLEECETVSELVEKEQKWLDYYKDDPLCLNIGFVAYPSPNEIEETLEETKKRRGQLAINYRRYNSSYKNKYRK